MPTPKAMIEDTTTYPTELIEIAFPQVTRELRVQVIRDILWYRGSQTDPVAVVLVRDPLGQWRDEALVTTDPRASAAFVIQGYCRRWSVERAHPMAWFVESLVILWYCVDGHRGSHVERDRPWYAKKVTPTFTDMPGALRLQIWEHKLNGESGEEVPSPECIRRLLHTLSAVA